MKGLSRRLRCFGMTWTVIRIMAPQSCDPDRNPFWTRIYRYRCYTSLRTCLVIITPTLTIQWSTVVTLNSYSLAPISFSFIDSRRHFNGMHCAIFCNGRRNNCALWTLVTIESIIVIKETAGFVWLFDSSIDSHVRRGKHGRGRRIPSRMVSKYRNVQIKVALVCTYSHLQRTVIRISYKFKVFCNRYAQH